MSRTKQPLEITKFNKGLITEANPLTFPPDASVDEQNFNISRDGTRQRRLGINFEDSFVLVDSEIDIEDGITPQKLLGNLPSGVFRWDNVKQDPSSSIAVVWFGHRLHFYFLEDGAVSSNVASPTIRLTNFAWDSKLSLTQVDGIVIVASGSAEVAVLDIPDTDVEATYHRILVRDMFGVEDLYSGTDVDGEVDLRNPDFLAFRPVFKTDTHMYNLRNQNWGLRRPNKESRDVDGTPTQQSYDAVVNFHTGSVEADDLYNTILPIQTELSEPLKTTAVLPSNADNIYFNYFVDPDEAKNVGEALFIRGFFDNEPPAEEAPKGRFIIDLLNRGSSRLAAYDRLMDRHPLEFTSTINSFITTLNDDITSDGASVVAEFAGRIWYGGFSGDVTGPDAYSPKLSSYITFSKLVDTTADINKCYQIGDPTSDDTSDVVDTDGGFIRITGAYNIQKMVNIDIGLIVLAENGVWAIVGATEDAGFTASGYSVIKISDYGITSSESTVVVDNQLLYWSVDGIYTISRNEVGKFTSTNLTQPTIQSFYEDIPNTEKAKCSGFFDKYSRKIHWTYGATFELVLDLTHNAFLVYNIGGSDVGVISAVETTPFAIGTLITPIEASAIQVQVDGEDLVEINAIRTEGTAAAKYLVVMDNGGDNYDFTFAQYRDQSFIDWIDFDSVGHDAHGYMVTGYLTGGDAQRYKQVPYLTTHFLQTESGFDENFDFLTPSSCLIQSQWDWTNSVNSNRWGREFQAYRLRRAYFSGDQSFENGHTVVSTKNKLRGKGKAVSMLLKTEPLKDCQILGWNMVVGVNSDV